MNFIDLNFHRICCFALTYNVEEDENQLVRTKNLEHFVAQNPAFLAYNLNRKHAFGISKCIFANL